MRTRDKEKVEEIVEEKIKEHEEASFAHMEFGFWFSAFLVICVIIAILFIYHANFVAPYLNTTATMPHQKSNCELLKEKLNGTSWTEVWLGGDCQICWENCTEIDGKLACNVEKTNCKYFNIR
jgi:hypothetical protein